MPFLVGYVTPQDFGAVGNGTADDTAAIQAALNAVSANGSSVFMPTGTYKITSTLTASVTGTELVGNGWGSQIIYDGSVVTTAINASGNIRLFMRDIRISQTNASHLGTALDLSQTNSGVIERLLIDGGGASGVAPNIGITMNAATCHYNTIRNCRINYGGTSAKGINVIGASHSNTLQDIRLIPQGDDVNSSGVYVNGTHSTTMIHVDIENGAGNGVWLDTGAHNTVLVNPYCELNNIGLKISSGVIAPVVTGATLQTSTTTNLQDNGSIAPQILNAWPNSGTATLNHLSFPNTDQFLINGLSVPGNVYLPSDHGYIAWPFDPTLTSNSTISVSGTVYLAQVTLRYAATVTKASISIASAASGVTANQNFLGFYDSTGTRQAVTAAGAIDAGLASSGVLTANFAASFSAPAGNYWIAFVNNATTPTTLGRASGFQSTPNANLSAANFRWAVNGTAQTSLPASITPASNTSTNNIVLWAAVG